MLCCDIICCAVADTLEHRKSAHVGAPHTDYHIRLDLFVCTGSCADQSRAYICISYYVYVLRSTRNGLAGGLAAERKYDNLRSGCGWPAGPRSSAATSTSRCIWAPFVPASAMLSEILTLITHYARHATRDFVKSDLIKIARRRCRRPPSAHCSRSHPSSHGRAVPAPAEQ